MGTVAGRSRRVLGEAEIVERFNPEAPEIKFAEVANPKSCEDRIRKRERDYGCDLSPETIESEEGKLATLENTTIARLERERNQAYVKLDEYTSKKPHWAYAKEQRGQIKFAEQMDRSLKTDKPAKKPKITPEEAAAAAAFVAPEGPVEESD